MNMLLMTAVLTAATAVAPAPDQAPSVRLPVVLFDEGPSDFPSGALSRGEKGSAIVMIADDGAPKGTLIESSGFGDLDEASLAVAVNYYRSGQTKGAIAIALCWSPDVVTGPLPAGATAKNWCPAGSAS